MVWSKSLLDVLHSASTAQNQESVLKRGQRSCLEFLGDGVVVQGKGGIPGAECRRQVAVERPSPGLQEQIRAFGRPPSQVDWVTLPGLRHRRKALPPF